MLQHQSENFIATPRMLILDYPLMVWAVSAQRGSNQYTMGRLCLSGRSHIQSEITEQILIRFSIRSLHRNSGHKFNFGQYRSNKKPALYGVQTKLRRFSQKCPIMQKIKYGSYKKLQLYFKRYSIW
jgi:hypothetical protein